MNVTYNLYMAPNIAFGSLMEVLAQVDIAKDLEYITIDKYRQIEEKINEISRMLSSLRAKRIPSPLTSNL